MKNAPTRFALIIAASCLFAATHSATAQGTAFTYQGRLNDGGNGASGNYDLVFALYNDPTAGSQQGTAATNSPVGVTNGLFTTVLDFGATPLNGQPLWLQIQVRTNGGGAFTPLLPRQRLTAAPYAVFATTASNLSGTLPSTQLSGTVPNANLSGTYGNVLTLSNAGNSFTGSHTGNGAGLTNLNASQLLTGTVADARLSGNVALLNSNQIFTGIDTFNNVVNFTTTNIFFGTITRQMLNLFQTNYAIGVQDFTVYFRTGGGYAWYLGGAHTNSQNNPGTGGVMMMKLDGTGNLTVSNTVTAPTFNGSFNGPGAMNWQIVSGTTQLAQANNGYILTNNTLTTITLPASPNPGDIVRVSGTGTGGWRISQNASQSISTGNPIGNIGIIWTPRESTRLWQSVASSIDGTRLIAATDGGLIYTSTDSGVGWTPAATNASWMSVASSSDGNTLFAGADFIYRYPDFTGNWVPRGPNGQWISVASSYGGDKVVAANAVGQLYTSTNTGLNWTARDTARNWSCVASSSSGSNLVAGANGSNIFTSIDSGVTWTPRESARFWSSVASSADGTKLVAVVGGGIYTSADSGVTWISRDNSNRNWHSVACSSDGTKLVAVVYGGQIYTATLPSLTGTTSGIPGYLLGSQNCAIELQYVGNGQFLPLSHEGTILAF